MKKIEAIIRPGKLEDVKEALYSIDIQGITVTQVSGAGKQKGKKSYYRGSVVDLTLLSKVKIEIIVQNSRVSEIVNVIIGAAKTGSIGDGKIFVYSVEEAIRIRTGESGDSAI